MENLTQQQIEELIQFIDEAEEPATITNTIVAAVLAFLAVKIAGTATAQALLEEIVARQTADTNLSTAINQLQQLIQSMGSVVYFDSMGELDGDVDIHVDTGMVVYDPENDIIKKYTSPSQYEPVSCDAKLLYCNKVTGYFYRYSTRSGMVQVGGGGGISEDDIINDLTTGGRNKALSAEMGKELARMIGNSGSSRILEQRVAIIAEILQNAVFISDQSQRFEDLAALEDAVDSITLNVSSHTFNGIGGTFILVATTVPSGKSVIWESSRPGVASVDSNGVVTPVGYGTCVITAKAGSNNVVATCSITVQQFQVDSVSIDQSDILLDSVAVGYTKQLTATTMYNGQAVQAGVTWSSSNPGVATIDANTGLVTVIGNGQTTITAISGTASDTITIRVSGIVQTFHVNVSTLSNVTIEDGQGNAITNGQAILEDSALTINFVPAASHEISALSVAMGSTTLTLADATDGTDGAKVISIQSVSGDIAISASATYVRTNLISNATKLTNYGVLYNTGGNYGSSTSYDCFIVPLDFGKRYEVNGYDWSAKNGVSGGYNIALVKSDGNGGFTNLLGTDITDADAFDRNNTIFKKATNVYKDFKNDALEGNPEHFFVTVPVASAFDAGVDKVYLAINTRYSSLDISSDISMYEFLFGEQYDSDDIIEKYGLVYPNYLLLRESSYDVSIVKAVKGATYSYGGMKWSELNANGDGFCVALLKRTGGAEMIDNLKNTDFKSGASWLSNDSYFNKSANISKARPAETGLFTIPTSADLAADTDIYIAITTRYLTTNISSYITLTKQ